MKAAMKIKTDSGINRFQEKKPWAVVFVNFFLQIALWATANLISSSESVVFKSLPSSVQNINQSAERYFK